MIPVLPVFLVLHQRAAITLTEEWMLVRVLLCSTYLLSPPLPSAAGIFKVLFSTAFESDTVWPFLTIRCYLWVYWCVTLQYHHSLGASADPCSKRVPLAFQHLSGLSHNTTTAKNICFNAVNTGHSLYVFSLFLIVSSGLWNCSLFWSHRILSMRQRQIYTV